MMLSAGTVALILSSGAWAAGETSVDVVQIPAADTLADHEAIARRFDAEAVAADAKAEAHVAMARTYQAGGPLKGSHTAMAGHRDRLAKLYRAIAEENRQLATAHWEMARVCCGQP